MEVGIQSDKEEDGRNRHKGVVQEASCLATEKELAKTVDRVATRSVLRSVLVSDSENELLSAFFFVVLIATAWQWSDPSMDACHLMRI
jgi:hypothetical protein